MKIAVTGANGFIGRYVLTELERQQVEVVAVTRDAACSEGLDINGRIIEIDLAVPEEDYFARLDRPDVLIHLAWDGLPNYNSLHHFETELPRQFCFLKAMVEAGLSSLIVAGTCFEYGMQSGPLSEVMVTRPSNPYGYAKDALRKQLEFLRAVKPFALTWARLFYMYGEGQHGTSLYPKLHDAVLRKDKTFNMSGGEQLRDYLHVSEVAKHIVSLALAGRDIGIVNICSGVPISVRKLVEGWIELHGWDIDLNLGYYSYPDFEPMAFWGDRKKLDMSVGR